MYPGTRKRRHLFPAGLWDLIPYHQSPDASWLNLDGDGLRP